MKRIFLENTGNYALVDDEDYDLIFSFGKWYENDSGYAVKRGKYNGRGSTIRMHTVINQTPKRLVTDHINGNRLDNRRFNLRSVGHAINVWNTHNIQDHKVYDLPKGMSYDKSRRQYVATRTIRRRFDNIKEAQEFINSGVNEL